MTAKELIELIMEIKEKYNVELENLEVCVNLHKDDYCMQISDRDIYTDNIQGVSETTDENKNVNGICISNYIM